MQGLRASAGTGRAPAAALVAAVAALMVVAADPAPAEEPLTPPVSDAETMALAVPLGVVEVAVGGSWKDGPRHGAYRAVVVQTGGDASRAARVYLQWVLEAEDGRYAGIAANVAIAEFNDRAVPEVSVALEGAGENVARLTLESPEAADPALRRMVLLAARPGKYVVVGAPPNAGSEADAVMLEQDAASAPDQAGRDQGSAPGSTRAALQPSLGGTPRAASAPPGSQRVRRKIRKRSKANAARPGTLVFD